ncbi:alpha/beta hydrolase [Pseudomaricurvus alcaniphilus]|uniref:alpha/beta fold hydrolase n=1 Tax=Pseudomaricurvus alcaniphilus TaxID=1166482 RepID=UPI00140A9517|nr:alpha/beta hydrolase [Pseudomaricurvus alcaniphilus]
MKQSDGVLLGSTGSDIYYQLWEPEGGPRALLLVAHGLAEHGGRYAHLAELFTARGIAVAALDHYGHGRSAGDRCYVPAFSHYTDTLEIFRQHLLASFQSLPVYLVGHSMGGLISANYLLQHQHKLAGCVLSGPALQVSDVPGKWQQALLKTLAQLTPRAGVLALDGSAVSRDEAVVKAYFDDPLVYNGKVSARLAVELFAAMQAPLQHAGSITLPMLIMHGEADSMVSPEGSRRFFAQLASADKELIVYPDLYHEIFNEPEKDEVLGDLVIWLEARLAHG